jgi:hypothetical protein
VTLMTPRARKRWCQHVPWDEWAFTGYFIKYGGQKTVKTLCGMRVRTHRIQGEWARYECLECAEIAALRDDLMYEIIGV